MGKFQLTAELPVPFRAAAVALAHDPAAVLGPGAGESERFGVEAFGFVVSEEVEVEVGEVEVIDRPVRVAAVDVKVHASGGDRAFPLLDAELEVTPTRDGVEVALEGRYDPPAGFLGELLDHVLLYRVAEASISRYFRRVVERLRRAAEVRAATSEVRR